MEQKHNQKYQGLQALRFVAAFLVVIYHATTIVSEQMGGMTIWKKGGFGIDIFFVLSGFVIVYSSASIINSPNSWRIFAERRLVRVVPMYWIATVIKATAIVAASSMVVHANLTWYTLLASLMFIPCRNLDGNFMPILGVGWTLNYEMFFYALFTLALFLRKNIYGLLGIILIALSVGSVFRQQTWPWPSFYLSSLVLEFYLGMLVAKFRLRGKVLDSRLAIPLLLVAFVFLLTPTPLDRLPPLIPEGLPAACIVLALVSLEENKERVPKVVLFLSEASYSIYLFHLLAAQLPVVFMVNRHLIYPWIAVFLSIFISLLVGSGVHQYVERPITNWFRDRLKVRHRKIIHAV